MKTIMSYGDSLTWGYNPADGTRYPFEQHRKSRTLSRRF